MFLFFYFRGYFCIADCAEKADMTDFEPYMEKFVELDLARFVTNEILYNKKIMLFLFEKGNRNLLKPEVQASKDKLKTYLGNL